jgi:hypothetical protein
MTDPVVAVGTLAKVSKAVLAVTEKLREIEARNTSRLEEAWQIEQRSYRARRDQEMETKLAALEAKSVSVERFAARVCEMVEDHQFLKLQANLEYEALRETTDERREMLAYAAAGLSDPGMPINDKARVERVLRQLDGDDVIHLFDVARGKRAGTREQLDVDILVAAGCVRFEPFVGFGSEDESETQETGAVALTRTGKLVVRVMTGYNQLDGGENA